MTRNSGVAGRIQQYLHDRPGAVVSVGDMVAGLGMPSSTISAAAGRLADEPGNGVRRAGPRGAFIYTGRVRLAPDRKPVPVGTLMECVGQSTEGDPMVRDEAGVVYVAKAVR